MKLFRSFLLFNAVGLLAFAGLSLRADEAAAKLTGNWKWVAPVNPDGQVPAVTFTFKVQGQALTGTVNKTAGAEVITNGIVKGDQVTFQTVRVKPSRTTTVTYSGKRSGEKITGTIEIESGGKSFSPQVWEAARVKE